MISGGGDFPGFPLVDDLWVSGLGREEIVVVIFELGLDDHFAGNGIIFRVPVLGLGLWALVALVDGRGRGRGLGVFRGGCLWSLC